MNCYSHRDIVAVGICKNCGKAVCVECAQDTGNGLACGPECAAEVVAHTAQVKFRNRFFGIGATGKGISVITRFFALFSILILTFFVYNLAVFNRIDVFYLGFLVFTVSVTIMLYRREK